MEKSYLNEKKNKSKKAKKFVWVIIVFAVLFIILVARFALSNTDEDIFNGGEPSSAEVYAMAKNFVTPTIKASDLNFSDAEYQFGKKPDSVYIIKSFVEAKDNTGEEKKTNFEIVLKYKGGSKSEQQNWSVLNLNEF